MRWRTTIVRSTKRIEEYLVKKAEEQGVKKRRVGFENSDMQFQEPSGDKHDVAENTSSTFD